MTTTTTEPTDFRDILSRFHETFADRSTRRPATGFEGRNFMTDEILGYVSHDGTVVEISTGMFLGDRLYGVTYPRTDDGPDDRSDCHHTWASVVAALSPAGSPAPAGVTDAPAEGTV